MTPGCDGSETGISRPEVRFHGDRDRRRDQLVALFKLAVREHGPRGVNETYDADIEYLEYAIEAFANTLTGVDLT